MGRGHLPDTRNTMKNSLGLSERELEILELKGWGLQNNHVATVLTIEPSSVASHLERIYRKLGVSSCTGAIKKAKHAGCFEKHFSHRIKAPLTEREKDVGDCIARGLKNEEIATALYLSPTTVKTYIASLLTKTTCTNRVALATFFLRNNS